MSTNHTLEWLSTRPFLIISVLIFTSISVFTTADGFKLIWQEGNEQGLVAWGFAVALGCLMTYITFDVAKADPGTSIRYHLIAYSLITAISVFFNFHSFYSRMNRTAVQTQQFNQLHDLLQRLVVSASRSERVTLRIHELETQLAESLAGMQYEQDHPLQPGRGARYTKHYIRSVRVREQLELQRRQLEAYEQSLSSYSTALQRRPALSSYSAATQAAEEMRTLCRQLIASEPSLSNQLSPRETAALEEAGNPTDLGYSLEQIARELTASLHGDWRRMGFFRFWIALTLSILVDVTVFASIVILHYRQVAAANVPSRSTVQPVMREDDNKRWDSLV
jgi:hypothetical protein